MGLRAQAGFTLVELVIVIVLVGVLAVVAVPRMFDVSAWRLRAFADTLEAETRSMQRRALSQRRPITATITGSGVEFADASGTLASLSCPAASSPCIAEAGPRSVTFNAAHSGRASTSTGSALLLTIGSGGSTQRRLQIETETGAIRPLP
jgi:prepilin-type N-terminal cleavage/methylation domain-containing protein